MPSILQADLTLIQGRLERGVVVHVGRDGTITRIVRTDGAGDSMGGIPRPPIDESQPGEFGSPRARRKQRLRGRILVPGFVNGHSHAFQRLLRGRAEARGSGGQPDRDFWSWRDGMYRVTEALTPDDIETVSALAFMEMLLAGFTHVVEFHYLHHQAGGAPYSDPAETSRRVLEAADFAGIGITLLRVAYQRGGPDTPPSPPQQRFVDANPAAYARALEATVQHSEPGNALRPASVGVAAHSVRALDESWLRELGRLSASREYVIHANVAEQQREVEQCLAEHGRGPLEQLAHCGMVSRRFTAVHATHLAPGEAELLGKAGATACICPTTERNRGDGLPDLQALRSAGVSLAIGTDSHARIDPFAEIRALEDGERLRTQQRNVLAGSDGLVAPTLLAAGTIGGASSSGLRLGRIEEGARADLVTLEMDDPALAGIAATPQCEDALMSALVLAGHTRLVRDVWVAGRHVVTDGVLLRWAAAAEAYRKVAQKIWA